MNARKFLSISGVVVLAAVALSACRAEEQNRVLMYEPGQYKGKSDTQLSESLVNDLRDRTLDQAGSTGRPAGAIGDGSKSSDVRLPASQEINNRLKMQTN